MSNKVDNKNRVIRQINNIIESVDENLNSYNITDKDKIKWKVVKKNLTRMIEQPEDAWNYLMVREFLDDACLHNLLMSLKRFTSRGDSSIKGFGSLIDTSFMSKGGGIFDRLFGRKVQQEQQANPINLRKLFCMITFVSCYLSSRYLRSPSPSSPIPPNLYVQIINLYKSTEHKFDSDSICDIITNFIKFMPRDFMIDILTGDAVYYLYQHLFTESDSPTESDTPISKKDIINRYYAWRETEDVYLPMSMIFGHYESKEEYVFDMSILCPDLAKFIKTTYYDPRIRETVFDMDPASSGFSEVQDVLNSMTPFILRKDDRGNREIDVLIKRLASNRKNPSSKKEGIREIDLASRKKKPYSKINGTKRRAHFKK